MTRKLELIYKKGKRERDCRVLSVVDAWREALEFARSTTVGRQFSTGESTTISKGVSGTKHEDTGKYYVTSDRLTQNNFRCLICHIFASWRENSSHVACEVDAMAPSVTFFFKQFFKFFLILGLTDLTLNP